MSTIWTAQYELLLGRFRSLLWKLLPATFVTALGLGVFAWASNPGPITASLGDAELIGADLRNAKLVGAKLDGANLTRAKGRPAQTVQPATPTAHQQPASAT